MCIYIYIYTHMLLHRLGYFVIEWFISSYMMRVVPTCEDVYGDLTMVLPTITSI